MSVATYSLLTLRPDLERLDTLCVGMIVRLDGTWTIRLLPDTTKLKAVDAAYPAARLAALADNLLRALQQVNTLVEARARLRLFGGSVHLHEFEGVISYVTVTELEAQIRMLMAELVLPANTGQVQAPALAVVPRRPKVHTLLKRQFATMGILGEQAGDIDRHMVVQNFPISTRFDITAQFALRNGALNLTETLDFGTGDEVSKAKKQEAHAKCLVLKTARDEFGATTRCHVVVSTSGVTTGVDRSVDLLSTVANVYSMDNTADMDSYFEAISHAAGVPRP